MSTSFTYIATGTFTDPQAALAHARLIYDQGISFLRDAMRRYVTGERFSQRARAFYPFVRIRTRSVAHHPNGLSYGFVRGPGTYETTLTRPDLFAPYYEEQFRLLLQSHGGALEVGTSRQPIPVHFSFTDGEHLEGDMDVERRARMHDIFDLPDLAAMDDSIANGTHAPHIGNTLPLSLFTAPRVDYSLQRLRHYTGTRPEWFQGFVLFTNYQFYIDEFIALGQQTMQDPQSPCTAFIQPGNVVSPRCDLPVAPTQGLAPARLPQMPAWHLVRPDGNGVTMINIGVGPSNAKTITDHVAVLRPHAWLMLGHCAGLRTHQRLGDYVLAHAYVREDHVLDEEVPLNIPIPALAEIQVTLEDAVAEIATLDGDTLKDVMRTGTVASTDNRNWELLPSSDAQLRFSQSRAIAVDMESATIATNGFRFRVPYGTLLCVSDKPLHGGIKLPGMADHFYRARVEQHLRIGMNAIERLRAYGNQRMHSRKLRSFADVAFR